MLFRSSRLFADPPAKRAVHTLPTPPDSFASRQPGQPAASSPTHAAHAVVPNQLALLLGHLTCRFDRQGVCSTTTPCSASGSPCAESPSCLQPPLHWHPPGPARASTSDSPEQDETRATREQTAKASVALILLLVLPYGRIRQSCLGCPAPPLQYCCSFISDKALACQHFPPLRTILKSRLADRRPLAP